MLVLLSGLVGAVGCATLAGTKVFVVQPIAMIPDGVTLIVFNQPALNLIDSPDAVCQRKLGYVSLMCRGSAVSRFVTAETILLRLPFSSWLYQVSGAPEVDR